VGNGFAGIALCGDDGERALVGNLLPDLAAAVSLVGNDGEWLFLPVEEGVDHLAVVDLATADLEAQRAALFVYSRVNLACATAA
jgi:hypothetical protein